jgi:hypothetical protein
MDIVTVAIVIVAATVAAGVRYAFHRDPRQALGFGVALLVFGLIVAAGPRVLGG